MPETGTIGVLGGSGLYQMDGLEVEEERSVTTPFGEPSDPYIIGNLDGRRVIFLPRHGRGHRLLPSEVNYRANICGFKMLGVERIVSVSAVGSLKEDIHPLHVVLPDQFIDRTKGRASTFFGQGVVAHVALADPVCPELHAALLHAAESCGVSVWGGGSYVCIEGPAFSTRAESHLYRSWGVSVIGMTNVPEVQLAREAEMCYATLALVTDFDCWHESEDEVSVEMLMENLGRNASAAQRIIRAAVPAVSGGRSCLCGTALAKALVTPPDAMPPDRRKELDFIVGKYVE